MPFYYTLSEKERHPARKKLTEILNRQKAQGWGGGGRHSTEVAFALYTQPARVEFSAFPRFFRNFLMLLRFNDSALLREVTVQSLIAVQTHLVLVRGKLVQQKKPKHVPGLKPDLPGQKAIALKLVPPLPMIETRFWFPVSRS